MKNVMTIFLVAVVLGLCSSVQATTYYVEPGESIQAAIDAASYGNTVQVAAGTYEENITLKDGVAVIGAGASDTTIDGGGTGSVVIASECGPDTVLEGFNITGGNAEYGGGMYNENSSTTVTNCIFSDNTASAIGGGMYNKSSSPTVTNCTFTGNNGCGMSSGTNCSPTVTDCIFTGNSGNGGGGMTCGGVSYPTVTNCTFSYNTAYQGAGISNNSRMTVINCTFIGNTAASWGGGMRNDVSSDGTIIINCTFIDNSVNGEGGAMYTVQSSPTIINCIFSGNVAGYHGGGIRTDLGAPIVTGCMFIGNKATLGNGGGMNNFHNDPIVNNCTFSGNEAGNCGGAIFNKDRSDGAGDPMITNCIIWGNSAAVGDEIGNIDLAKPIISYSDIAGCGGSGPGWDTYLGTDGGGNIDADPLFVNALTDLHLLLGSPCIDAGDNTAVPVDVTTDLDGNPRIVNDVVDMGAYEIQLPGCDYLLVGDVNDDCKFDINDFVIMAANWLIDCNVDPANPACVPK